MMRPMTPLRRGRGKLEIDPEMLAQLDEAHRQRRGFFGGDPYRRHANNPFVPPEPSRWFCLAHASAAQRRRLHTFLAEAPVEIEIGAGDGRFILEWAKQHPERHFLAFEVRPKLVQAIYAALEEQGLENVWVCDDDARAVIPEIIPTASVEIVHILMPDPWWKQKHARRRLVSRYMLDVLAHILKPGGILRFESDVEGYPELVDLLVADHPAFSPHDPDLAVRFADAPLTTRQHWCRQQGLPIYRRFYRRRPDVS